MKKLDFNSGWTFRKAEEPPAARAVTLPHDAMIHEGRSAAAPGGSDNAFFPGGTYIYEKTFEAPDAAHCEVLFEGVYRNATVALNGETLATHAYGYTPFAVTLDGKLHPGANTLTVTADNADAPSGRWYTGSGIYRPVWLYTGGKGYIRREGIRVTTLSVNPAQVQVEVDASGGLPAVELLDPSGRVVASGSGADLTLTVPDARLWSEDSPSLYTCRVTLTEGGELLDEAAVSFGIRRIQWNARQGLLVNGRSVKLRGACVHHDNGVVGACAFPESEERRVRKLKQAGFNAIRSAHNPCSAAMLDACDRYGVYVIDEAWDMWYNHKTRYDYADNWEANWQQDLTAMARRDYNHPSVIAYSIGNEVSEPAEAKGFALAHQMVELLHGLDKGRPVTAGINLMIIDRASRGQGIYANDGSGVQDERLMERAMREAKAAGRILAAHCEDITLVRGGCVHDGDFARAHGLPGISSASEYAQIERDLALAKKTGAAYHVCHISTAESVALIRSAKRAGADVTCETAPHYLYFCDDLLEDDGRFKMNPPIRSAGDRAALLEGIADGTIDMIATDHAPHAAEEKAGGLRRSLMGVPGLESAFAACVTTLVEPGVISLERLAAELFVSKYHIAHVFKDEIGMSIHQYISKKRLARCREALLGDVPVTKVYLLFGFHDYSSFYRAFKKEYGISPKDFKELHTVTSD